MRWDSRRHGRPTGSLTRWQSNTGAPAARRHNSVAAPPQLRACDVQALHEHSPPGLLPTHHLCSLHAPRVSLQIRDNVRRGRAMGREPMRPQQCHRTQSRRDGDALRPPTTRIRGRLIHRRVGHRLRRCAISPYLPHISLHTPPHTSPQISQSLIFHDISPYLPISDFP